MHPSSANTSLKSYCNRDYRVIDDTDDVYTEPHAIIIIILLLYCTRHAIEHVVPNFTAVYTAADGHQTQIKYIWSARVLLTQ